MAVKQKFICTQPCFHNGHRYFLGDIVTGYLDDMPKKKDGSLNHFALAGEVQVNLPDADVKVNGAARGGAEKVAPAGLAAKSPAQAAEEMTNKQLIEAISKFQDVKTLKGLKKENLLEILKLHQEAAEKK